MDKKVMKELANHLSKYTSYKKEILEIEEKIINNSKTDVNTGIRSKNKISRGTENLAIKLATHEKINKLRKWISVIDDLQIELLEEPIKLRILKYKYIDKREKVMDYQVINKLEEIGYPLSKNLYYTLKEQILYKLEKMARYQHLLDEK